MPGLFWPTGAPGIPGRQNEELARHEELVMTPKVFLAAAIAAAIAVGLALPVPHKSDAAAARPQVATFELGRR